MKYSNTCKTIELIDKINNLLKQTSDRITSKLKDTDNCSHLYAWEYWSGFATEYYCTKEINGQMSGRKGNSSPIFYGLRIKESSGDKDYPPLIVCLHDDVINDAGKNNKNYKDHDINGDWYYFDIGTNILTSNNYEEDFVNKVVEIISKYYNGK